MKTISAVKLILTFSFLFLIFSGTGKTQWINDQPVFKAMDDISASPNQGAFYYKKIPKLPGHYSRQDWQQRIDSVWGPGLPTATKLEIFDRFWTIIDTGFACFHNLLLNWDSLKQVYRTEISGGVSRGRFCAILNHLYILLREPHTMAYDDDVFYTPLFRGTPLFVINGIGNSRFGAGLTPLSDSSLLVYSVVQSHPLGLQMGDRILGYDNIPWKVLYKQLLDWELPITSSNWIGGSPSSFTQSMLRSAGRNWHLFDTIDIVKYNSGDTVHLPTTLMDGTNLSIFNTEQMDIPGVPKPGPSSENVSYGIIEGTNIGYIYVWGWYGQAQFLFYNAVQNLMQTDGLIIDFRFNYGGNMFFSNPGLSLLFDSNYYTIDFARRCSPNNYEMCPMNISNEFIIPGSSPGYTRPIAVLTGQGAVSSGDQVALRFKYHKHSRFFGKSTSTAFNSPVVDSLAYHFTLRHAAFDSYQLNNPNVYLTHKEFPVDEDVWLTPEKVSQGRDDVVEAAIAWINTVIGITKIGSEIPLNYNLSQNYPNPFNPSTKIKFSIPKSIAGESQRVKLIIYDILGREIAILVNEKLKPGTYEAIWDAKNFSSGVYFYKLSAGSFTQTKKMLLIK